MKIERAVLCSSLFVLLSIVLHGCDFGESEASENSDPPEELPPAPRAKKTRKSSPPPALKKAAAKCHGGHFHCDGGWKEWCSRMEKQCKPKDCAPMCSWTCDSPQCNQECGPVCNQPACSTRCKGFNTDSCKMKCGKPSCKVVCPKHFCPSEDCAACKTECGKPACTMECGVDEQPCRHVCAQPVCKWECKNPSLCPKPKCAMKCKKAPDCMQKMHMFSKVPPLEPGETEIVTMDQGPAPAPAPALLMQRNSASMRVNFTRMDDDRKLHSGHVDLALVQEEMVEVASWTATVHMHDGRMVESQASCEHGSFSCQGDAGWCAEQEKIVCKDGQDVFLHRRSRAQSHLQP